MKTRILAVALVLMCLMFTEARTACAQSGGGYSLTWSSINSGGVLTSTGGAYQMAATIGQPDAAVSTTTGDYTIGGGFWQPVVYLVYMPAVLRP